MNLKSITNFDLCLVMKNSEHSFTDTPNQLRNLTDFVISNFNLEDKISFKEQEELKNKLRSFLAHTTIKYKKDCRIFDQFVGNAKNSTFLQNLFRLPHCLLEKKESSQDKDSLSKAKARPKLKPGRKLIPFTQKSLRGQQYASAKIRQDHEPGAIILAASQQSSPLGQLVKKTNSPSGTTARLAIESISSAKSPGVVKKSPLEALAFILTNDLSKEQYLNMKKSCAASNADIWPNYNHILEAKRMCRPPGIVLQELCAELPLQNLLNHTVESILQKNPVISVITNRRDETDLLFYFKFGLDGCGSFNTAMQKGSDGKIPDGSTLLFSQLVPLKIVQIANPDIIIYQNHLSNSPHSCRPIRLCYERETKDSIRAESSRLQQQVSHLQPFILQDNPKVRIIFKGLFTMVDGKVLQELTNSPAASSCPICHKTYRQIALPDGDFIPKDGSLQYGASILHFGLRTFEALCHIGYRQDVKKSRVQLTPAEKEKIAKREQEVKAQFQERLGLIVDQRRDGGAGNTTTGNVARKAFDNPAVTSEILGVPQQLVENLGILWRTMASGFDIDPKRFEEFCLETKAIYFDAVPWFSLPPTLHKIFEHGRQLVEECPVPLGLTNEEASEANNKVLRSFRQHHTRRSSWQEGIQDLFHRMMEISDPAIQKLAHYSSGRYNKTNLPSKVLGLLKLPEFYPHASGDEIANEQ